MLLIITLYNPQSPKPAPTVMAPKEAIEQTVLSFGELVATSSSSTNVNYSIPINIETGKNKVTAVQLELQFDPKVLTNIAVVPGSFFTKPEVLLEQIDEKTGRITYAFGIGLTGQGVAGQGTVATLNFGTKAALNAAKVGTPQQTTILFLPKTLVTAEDTDQSVLKQTNNIQFIIGEKTSTPSAQ